MDKVLIDRYLISLDSSPEEAVSIAKTISTDIELDNVKLIELIEVLGRYLTDEDTSIRIKALNCISVVLSGLSTSKLNSRQITMLSEFFGDRLEDEECLMECCGGLLALSKMKNMPASAVKAVAQALFSRVDMSKHNQSVRYAVYQLLKSLINSHINVMKSINDEAIEGYTRLVASEKDPRNLIVIFTTLRTIMETFEVEKFKDTLFDAAFCYFPITFRPPPDDPYGITADDLKLKLRDCIAASPFFAEYSFVSLIEKLTSSSLNVKRDTVLTLTACVTNYGILSVEPYWQKIFDSVKFEVLHDGEDDVPDLVCDLIKALTTTLSHGLLRTVEGSSLESLITSATRECNEQITNLESRQAKSAAKILVSIAEGSYPAFVSIAESTLPGVLRLLDTSSSHATVAQQKILLEILVLYVDAAGNVYGRTLDVVRQTGRKNGLLPYKDSLFEVFSKAFVSLAGDEVSYRMLALGGLVKLALLLEFLDSNELGMVTQYLDDVVLTDSNDALCSAALSSLRELGQVRPELIMNIVFPAFLSQLPDPEIPESDSYSQSPRKHYRLILSFLVDLCINKGIFDMLTVRLLNRLSVIAKYGQDVAFAQSIFATILLVIQRNIAQPGWDTKYFYAGLVPKVISMTVVASIEPASNEAKILASLQVVSVSSKIVNLLVRAVSIEEQQELAGQVVSLFLTNEPSLLIAESHRERVAKVFKPLVPGYEPAGLIELFTSAVAGLRRELNFPSVNVLELTTKLVPVTLASKNTADRLAMLRLITLLTNKWFTKEDENQLLDTTVKSLEATVSSSSSLSERRSSLELLAWIGKSYILKCSRRAFEAVDLSLELLRDPVMGTYASKACGIFISDDEIVDKSNHVIVRLLAKQQYFSYSVQKIVDGFNSCTETEAKRNYLVALSNILQSMPGKVVLPMLPTFLPLLLQSLSIPDAQVKLASIDTITATMLDASDTISNHLATIVPRILESTIDQPFNKPKVRIAALNCLSVLPTTLAGDTIRPYRQEIIRKLTVVLDDPRRDVRKAAVDCRQTYYAMDA
ncbi:Dos2-interacting transcription regulator of RNA-Pol-II-domain-containing protein [Lipomyces arxii]|uniref:Dos2-interacting transcription regulator of RNA-Pol-II-domain-containing protein n=1 Tax=Lipomyces arxii TaxID=56418 RepID=UPI0034CE3D3A